MLSLYKNFTRMTPRSFPNLPSEKYEQSRDRLREKGYSIAGLRDAAGHSALWDALAFHHTDLAYMLLQDHAHEWDYHEVAGGRELCSKRLTGDCWNDSLEILLE